MNFTHPTPIIILGALFVGVSVLHLAACYRRMPKIRTVTKTLLMPLLGALYCVSAKEISPLVVTALAFGWLGDVFLLFKGSKLGMLLGIASFALGHVFYIGAMLSGYPSPHVLMLVPLALCAVWLVFVYKKLIPYAPKSLRKPGFLYALLLSWTGLSALYLLLVTQKLPYLVAFIGGLFFMLSDTILTGNQYRKELKHGNFYVMLTYILAQSLLILGFVLNGGM
ncbi:MAG: lysoplasmalogenase [Clostridia bacterium]|nr:lysoplasmalogenase [Clostridia bacterium]